MRAGKAYISSLGTTGLLVASSLSLLFVVGALVAFDRWPNQAAAEPETMAIGEPRDADPARSGVRVDIVPQAVAAAVTGATAEPAVSDAASVAAAGRVQSGAATAQAPAPDLEMQPAAETGPAAQPAAPAAPVADPVPAAPVSPPSGAPSAPGPVISPDAVIEVLPGEGGLDEVAGDLGDTTGGVSPVVGTTVRDTGVAIEALVGGR